MEKRLILAIVLSFLVLMGYQYFFVKPDKTLPRSEAPITGAPSTPVPGTSGAIQEQPKPAALEAKPEPTKDARTPDLAEVAGEAETDIVVDTSLFKAVWSNNGGVLKSWTLKKHKNSRKEDLELVPALAAEIGRYPFSLGLDDTVLAKLLNASLFETSGAGLTLAKPGGGP